MENSKVEIKMNLSQKLFEVQKNLESLELDKTHPQFKYVSAENVIFHVREQFNKMKIRMRIVKLEPHRSIYKTAKGADMELVSVHIEIDLIDSESSERETIIGAGSGSDSGDKALLKALTSALKYALRMNFLIPQGFDDPEGDDKGNRDNHEENRTEVKENYSSEGYATEKQFSYMKDLLVKKAVVDGNERITIYEQIIGRKIKKVQGKNGDTHPDLTFKEASKIIETLKSNPKTDFQKESPTIEDQDLDVPY